MAKVTSGSFDTTKYSSRYLVFSWTCTQDTAKNQSTISWTLKGAGGTTTSYYMSAPFSVTIAGEEVYYSDTRIQLKNGTTVASGTKTITHNTDGTKSFSASVKAAIYSGSYNVSGSGEWELEDIPRAATITSATNFDDEGNPTIKYSNPLGNSVDDLLAGISFDMKTAPIAYRSISKTGSSYTFNFTDAERKTLRENCKDSNSTTVYFYLRTVIDGTNYHSKVAKTLSIINGAPDFTTVIKDNGGASTALTGGSGMIKGFNYISASITATPKKEATIKSYKITNAGKVVNSSAGVFENTQDNKFICYVEDSRGNTRTKTITLNMVEYVSLTCNADISISISDTDTTKAELKFKVTGNCFNGDFGAANNSLNLTLYIAQDGDTPASYTVTVPSSAFSGNTYSYTYTVKNLPYQSTYTAYVTVQDAIGNVKTTPVALKALPVFDWSETDFNFNVPVTINGLPFQNVVNAMTERYYLPTTISGASNYSGLGTSDAILVGNNLRCYFKATRSAIATGNVTNEKICTLTISHGGKIKNMYDGGITTSSAGAVNAYYMSNVKWDNTNNVVSFDIYLGATATGYVDMSGMFTVPVVINLNAY